MRLALLLTSLVAVAANATVISAPDGYSAERGDGVALSPDAVHVAFVVKRIVTRIAVASTLDRNDIRVLDDTDGASAPFWSPDGHTIGYFAKGQMRRIDAAGGRSTTLCAACDGWHATWGARGVILFDSRSTPAILAVDERAKKTPWPVTAIGTEPEYAHTRPNFFPDGDRFLYIAHSYGRGGLRPSSHVFLASMSERSRTLLATGEDAVLLDAGTVLFRGGDPNRDELSTLAMAGGATRVIARNTSSFHANGAGSFVRAEGFVSTELVWTDRNGKVLDVITSRGSYGRPRVSPDGHYAAYGDGPDLVVRDLRSRKALLSLPAADAGVAWSRDSRRIVAPLKVDGKCAIAVVELATGAIQKTSDECGQLFDWSPDGRYVAVNSFPHTDRFQLIAVDGSSTLTRTLLPDHLQGWLRFSPDGSRVAFDATPREPSATPRSGTAVAGYHAFVAPFDLPMRVDITAPPVTVSPSGGYRPAWRGDGSELFFVDGEQRMFSAAMAGAAQPKFLFVIPRANSAFAEYDVSADGSYFLINREVDDAVIYVDVLERTSS